MKKTIEFFNPKKHDRNQFDCGVDVLNTYLIKFANQDQKRSLTKIYVLAEETKIIGYYSISAHSILRNNLPDDHNLGGYNELPFLLLGRLAVDKNYHGQGFGDTLILHSFKTTLYAAETIGIMGIVVDAKDKKSASFYENFGFMRLSGNFNRLVLPITSIKKLLEKLV